MKGKIRYEFSAEVWRYHMEGGWYFVSLPPETSKEIRENLGSQEQGWGRMKATAQIGNSQWDTAIWFDTKHNRYLLPLNASVRSKEKLEVKDTITTIIWM